MTTTKHIVHKHFTMGTAPYKFVSLWSAPSVALAEANPTAYQNALQSGPKCRTGSCDHCGTGIIHHMIIRDATGILFAVGSECIKKVGEIENLTDAELALKEKVRADRAITKKKSDEKKAAAHEIELEAERKLYNGVTGSELRHNARQDALKKRATLKKKAAKEFVAELESIGSAFTSSLAASLSRGDMPRGRGEELMLECIAKQSGRRNSKAFNEHFAALEGKLKRMKKAWAKADSIEIDNYSASLDIWLANYTQKIKR